MKLITIPLLIMLGQVYGQSFDHFTIDTISTTITVVIPFNLKENDDVTPPNAMFVYETQAYSKSYKSSNLYNSADGLILKNWEYDGTEYSDDTKNLFANGFKVVDKVKKSGNQYNVLELKYKFERVMISKQNLLKLISEKNDSILYNEVIKLGSKMNYYVIYIPV